MFEKILLEEGGSGICGSAVACGERFYMSSMDECNTASHTRSRVLGEDLPGVKKGGWVVLAPSAPRLSSAVFFQPVFSGATASKIQKIKVCPCQPILCRYGQISFRYWRQSLSRPLCCHLSISLEQRVKRLRCRSELFH